jgi:hypothetical protein
VRLPPATHLVILVRGTKAQAQALKEQTAGFMREQMRLTLSPEKTHITHVDDGFDFLGFRIKRRPRSDPRRLQFPEPAIVPGRQTPHQGADRTVHDRPIARRARSRAQPDPTGLDQLPPPRRGQALLQLSRPLSLVAGDAVAAQEAPAADLETDQAKVLGAPLDQPGRHQALLARPSAGDPLPLQGTPNPNAVGNSRTTPRHHPDGAPPSRSSTMINQRLTLWSAGCVGTRTSGAEGGGEQTTACERGIAARLRPYIEIVRHTQRNVKRWQDGDMRKRWTAAGMLVAEQQFGGSSATAISPSSSSRSSATPTA